MRCRAWALQGLKMKHLGREPGPKTFVENIQYAYYWIQASPREGPSGPMLGYACFRWLEVGDGRRLLPLLLWKSQAEPEVPAPNADCYTPRNNEGA